MTAKDFKCPDCKAEPGKPCKTSRGNTMSNFHTRRTYLVQDAFLKKSLKKSLDKK